MKIEKNIPIPPKGNTGKFSNIAAEMEEGDSVKVESWKDAVALTQCIGRKHPLGKGSIRAQRDSTYRVWRIS
jgi:hypothetical protein